MHAFAVSSIRYDAHTGMRVIPAIRVICTYTRMRSALFLSNYIIDSSLCFEIVTSDTTNWFPSVHDDYISMI